MVEDITELKKREEELKRMVKELEKSEKFLRDVLESIQDGISVLDTDLNIRMVNSTMEKWYAKNMPLVGKKCYEAYHNRKTPCEKCPTLRCIKSGKMEREIISDPFKNYIELYSYPMKDENGNVVGVVEFVRDISLQKKAEEALKESEKCFRSLVENAHDAIYIISSKGFEYVNPAFEKLTGYSREELLSKDFSFWTLIHPDDVEKNKGKAEGEREEKENTFKIRIQDDNKEWGNESCGSINSGCEAKGLQSDRDIERCYEKIKAQEEISKLSNLHYYVGMAINRNDAVGGLQRFACCIKDVLDVDYGCIFMYSRDPKSFNPCSSHWLSERDNGKNNKGISS